MTRLQLAVRLDGESDRSDGDVGDMRVVAVEVPAVAVAGLAARLDHTGYSDLGSRLERAVDRDRGDVLLGRVERGVMLSVLEPDCPVALRPLRAALRVPSSSVIGLPVRGVVADGEAEALQPRASYTRRT